MREGGRAARFKKAVDCLSRPPISGGREIIPRHAGELLVIGVLLGIAIRKPDERHGLFFFKDKIHVIDRMKCPTGKERFVRLDGLCDEFDFSGPTRCQTADGECDFGIDE